MGYILFLISILVSSFYYFRMARKFESFDVHVTEELHREMDSLIVDFNQTAHQNISLLEDRISQGKVFVAEISDQLEYLRKLRDNLAGEVRDLQRRKWELQHEERDAVAREDTGRILAPYQKFEESFSMTKASLPLPSAPQALLSGEQEPMIWVNEKQEDTVEVTQEALIFSHSLFDEPEPPVKKEKQAPVSSKKQRKSVSKTKKSGTKPGVKERILAHYQAGKTIEEISNLLNIPRGEVELMIRLQQMVV